MPPIQFDRPAWCDPRWAINLHDFRVTTVDLFSGGVQACAKPDPTRWAIGFFKNRSSAGSVFVSPQPDPNENGINLDSCFYGLWFRVFEHGALPMVGWNVYTQVGGAVDVWEIFVQE